MILHNQKTHHPTLPVKSQMIHPINSKNQTQGQQLKFVDNFAVQSTNLPFNWSWGNGQMLVVWFL